MLNVDSARKAFAGLVLFSRVLEDGPAQAMARFLDSLQTETEKASRYLDLVRALYDQGPSAGPTGDAWQDYLLHRIVTDDQALAPGASTGGLPGAMAEAASFDLRRLRPLFDLTGPVCRTLTGLPGLPTWPGWTPAPPRNPAMVPVQEVAEALAAARDWGEIVPRLVEHCRAAGIGIMGRFWSLRWDGQNLRGIAEPDDCDLDDLIGLASAKATVLRNTEQLVKGAPANNLLLYGSRGTGKSSLVRSLASRYGREGLRLVEVDHDAMARIPRLFQLLRRSPQRFIIFLDDLSFDPADPTYRAFKSVVEGTLEQRPANTLLYATSNRRSLVSQTPEVRLTSPESRESLDEGLSLADRFGLTVLFTMPDQEEYLAIVQGLAARRQLRVDSQKLREAALRWVVRNNPRSGRAARQFIDDLAGRLA